MPLWSEDPQYEPQPADLRLGVCISVPSLWSRAQGMQGISHSILGEFQGRQCHFKAPPGMFYLYFLSPKMREPHRQLEWLSPQTIQRGMVD